MSVFQHAIVKALTETGHNIPTKYLPEDYKVIIEKSEFFLKKQGHLPSIDFLLKSSSKLTQDVEQADRIYDILYALSKLKEVPSYSEGELSELVLAEYKSDTMRALTKQLATALSKDQDYLIEGISKEISEISKLCIDNGSFLKNDIKEDVKLQVGKVDYLATGLPTDIVGMKKMPKGSIILITAPTGGGKTLLTTQAMISNYFSGQSILNINVELAKTTLLNRIKAHITEVPMDEIVAQEFLVQESSDKFFLCDFVLTYKLSMRQAYEKLKELEFDRDAFSEYIKEVPERTNTLKIIAAEDAVTNAALRLKGQQLDKLPNDVEILDMLEQYGDKLDMVIIDLISEIHYTSKGSREENLTGFVRQLNNIALVKGINIYIVSQVEGVKSYDALCSAKYSKGLVQSASLAIALIQTSTMKSDNLVGLVPTKTRHSGARQVGILNQSYAIQTLEDTYDQICSYDFENEVSAELRKKNEKK